MPSRLELYCSGYQQLSDPSKEDTVSFTVQEFNNLVQLLVSQTERIAELEFKLAKNRASKVKVNKLRCSRK